MRNLKHYHGNTFDFFRDVVQKKREEALKARMGILNEDIKLSFLEYKNLFDDNRLTLSRARGYSNQDKADLLSLYRYRSKVFQDLKITLTTNEQNRIQDTCQNCTINQVNTFDHILPKDEFAEFAVNPINLFPCCSQCNGYKSETWRLQNNALFLNLYLDILPQVQFLYVDLNFDENTISPKFYLDNSSANIDGALFSILESHYSRLHLLERFSRKSDDTVSELRNSIMSSLESSLPITSIVSIIKRTIDRNRKIYGHNHWEGILQQKLVESADFIIMCSS